MDMHAGIKFVLDQSPTPGREFILPFDEAGWGISPARRESGKPYLTGQPVLHGSRGRRHWSNQAWLVGCMARPGHGCLMINNRQSRRS